METVYTLEQKVKGMLAHLAALHQENTRLVALYEGLKDTLAHEQRVHEQHLELCARSAQDSHEHEQHMVLCTQTLDTLIADIDRFIAQAPLAPQGEREAVPQAHQAISAETAPAPFSSSLS